MGAAGLSQRISRMHLENLHPALQTSSFWVSPFLADQLLAIVVRQCHNHSLTCALQAYKAQFKALRLDFQCITVTPCRISAIPLPAYQIPEIISPRFVISNSLPVWAMQPHQRVSDDAADIPNCIWCTEKIQLSACRCRPPDSSGLLCLENQLP